MILSSRSCKIFGAVSKSSMNIPPSEYISTKAGALSYALATLDSIPNSSVKAIPGSICSKAPPIG